MKTKPKRIALPALALLLAAGVGFWLWHAGARASEPAAGRPAAAGAGTTRPAQAGPAQPEPLDPPDPPEVIAARSEAYRAQPWGPDGVLEPRVEKSPVQVDLSIELKPLPNGCTKAADGSPLQVRVQSARWQRNPLALSPFWSPTAAIMVCNSSGQRLKPAELTLALVDSAGREWDKPGLPLINPVPGKNSSRLLPELGAGEAIGPFRLYAYRGVPERVGEAWQADRRLWPSLTFQVFYQGRKLAEAPVQRLLAAPGEPGPGAPGATPEIVDPPPLPLLRALALSQATATLAGGRQAAFFLYSPDVRYSLVDASWCGASAGSTGPAADHWGIYLSLDGNPPVKLADAGQLQFFGGRGMKATRAAAIQTTFLMLEQYGSCAVPTFSNLYAYDEKTGALDRPKRLQADGSGSDATMADGSIDPDGQMVSRYWNNAEGKQYTDTYAWDAVHRIWRLAAHESK